LNAIRPIPAPPADSPGALPARYPSLPYILPFAVLIGFLGIRHWLAIPDRIDLPLRVVVLAAVLLVFSRRVISLRTSSPVLSIALGIAVFAIWIGPDLLFPGYRQHWLFQNQVMGTLNSSIAEDVRHNALFLVFRVIRAVLLVPIIEELFWRAWLMRWLIDQRFERIPLGAWSAAAFWITALLFASEHGPYWEVGLVTGVIYNWWMIRTKRLGDCILAHAVTNACLSAYVIGSGQWQYWL
jgi:CAAX prenyl protease-like protein